MTAVKRRHWFSLFTKALFPRFLFLAYGVLCVYVVVLQENLDLYWYLTLCLCVLFIEGIFNVIVRGGKEFHWFCPSAFLFCVVLIVTMTFLREGQVLCITGRNVTSCDSMKLPGNNGVVSLLNYWDYNKRASIIEQIGLLILIVGRWLLPQGSISKDQFCQILLIYIGTAADIAEFSEMYTEDDLKLKLGDDTANVLHGVMAVWAISVVQFSLTIALPEEGLKIEDEEYDDDGDNFEDLSYFRSRLRSNNRVTPMSYMHYKSLMREGMVTNDREGNLSHDKPSINRTYSNTFQDKYPLFATRNTALRSTKPRGLEPLGRQRKKAEYSPPLGGYRRSLSLNQQSIGSLNTRINISELSNNKVNMPSGNRIPTNIGSPEQSIRTKKSSKSSIGNVTIRSITSPQSSRSLNSNNNRLTKKMSTESRFSRKFLSSSSGSGGDNNMPPLKTWDRLLDRFPFSKRRTSDVQTLKRKDSTHEDNSTGIGKKEVKSCFVQYLDLIGILLPVCMQDGPFFIVRFVLISHYNVVTEMITLLVTKNALVIIVQIYRILIMYCSEPTKDDVEDQSTRVRAAMDTNDKLSGTSTKTKKASNAVQALSRMHARLTGHKKETNLKHQVSTPRQNGGLESGMYLDL